MKACRQASSVRRGVHSDQSGEIKLQPLPSKGQRAICSEFADMYLMRQRGHTRNVPVTMLSGREGLT